MASELCMNCFSVKGQYEVCPFCGYVEGTPPGQPHYLTPGTILANHFIVGTAIGFGGFGIIYKCLDTTLGVIVAVKEFYPAGLVNRAPGECEVGLLSGDRQQQYRVQLKRFLMEAQSIAQFGKAKDIVNVYDFFEANNTAYIIMEYVDGVLLKDYLEKQGRMETDVAISVITPIIEAVKKIHAKGIIHRDISPDNIFISGEDSIKVFDFGAAQLNDSSEGRAGEKVIKVGYSAPEQYRDKSRQDFYTDIYSVGAILYQMVTGVKPMESTEREFRDELKSPAELGVRLEPNIDRAIMEAMAVKPELRFQSIQHFEDAIQSRRIAEYPKEKLKKRKRRRNWMISLAATLVLAVTVTAGLFSTVLRPENRIFDSVLEDDEIVVWVENGEQKEKLQNIAKKNFVFDKESIDEKNLAEETEKLLKDNKKITVTVIDITEKDKNMTMDNALQKAKKEGKMPDMFLSDHVCRLDEYNLVSMKDNVYAAIDPEDYLYMPVYSQYFRDMKEMPTGINALMFYSYSIKENDKKKALQTSTLFDRNEGTIELSDIVSANRDGKNGRKEFTCFYTPYSTKAGILQNAGCLNRMDGIVPDTDLVNNLGTYKVDITQPVMKEKACLLYAGESKDGKTKIYGNSALCGVEYRQQMQKLQDAGATVNNRKNVMGDYQVSVAACNGKILLSYEDRYAISADSTKNQQTACMRLLWIMLGEAAQSNNYVADGSTPFPINSSAFAKFFDYNPKYKCLQNLIKSKNPDCVLIGRASADIESFERGMAKKELLNKKQIEDYCSQYAARKKDPEQK